MTLSPSEICIEVADIIDFDSERFDMNMWEETTDCGTVACIAGHVALMHQDGKAANYGDHATLFGGKIWRERQGSRLGLTKRAADSLFDPLSSLWMNAPKLEGDIRYSLVLRQMAKELEASRRIIGPAKLEQIVEEALI